MGKLKNAKCEKNNVFEIMSNFHTTDTLAYGEELTAPYEDSNDKVLNTITYTGHEKDYETNLTYMMARYYSQGYGRFLSPDPGYDYDQLDPMSWNLYAYVRGNPVKNVDPTGMWNRGGLELQHTTKKEEIAKQKAREKFNQNRGRSAIKEWSGGGSNDNGENSSAGDSQFERPEERPADGWYYTKSVTGSLGKLPGITKIPLKFSKLLKIISFDFETIVVINPKTNKAYKFKSISLGIGFGSDLTFGNETSRCGRVSMDNLSDYNGLSLSLSGTTAIDFVGISGQLYGNPRNETIGGEFGQVFGLNISFSLGASYTWGGDEFNDFEEGW